MKHCRFLVKRESDVPLQSLFLTESVAHNEVVCQEEVGELRTILYRAGKVASFLLPLQGCTEKKFVSCFSLIGTTSVNSDSIGAVYRGSANQEVEQGSCLVLPIRPHFTATSPFQAPLHCHVTLPGLTTSLFHPPTQPQSHHLPNQQFIS
jgi:hypothetical protein